jgi:UDP-N-acetylmuramate--alanine ligase
VADTNPSRTEPVPARPDLSQVRRVHIVGIGGSGMSAIATVLLGMGHAVSGSDAADSDRLRRLAAAGAAVHVGHDPRWVADAEVVAISTAVPAANVEVTEAARRGLRVWRRSQLLAAICAERRTVAVAGTHGKTSTSAMLAVILSRAGVLPSYIIGGDIVGIGSGAAWEPDGEWLVVEADESDGTFLELGAESVVVTSVEPDHLDFYGDEQAMREAFVRFVGQARGARVVCADDAGAAALAVSGAGPDGGSFITYGTGEGALVHIEDVTLGPTGSQFSVRVGATTWGTFELATPGLHNVRNAVAALTMAEALGVSRDAGRAALAGYRGVGRRFERRGARDGVTFVDDYGHLPGEVAAMMAAVRSGGWDRIVVIFQPHRYSRTAALWPDFAHVFEGADVLLVTDIYAAGEPSRAGVTGRLIAEAVGAAHGHADVRYVPTLDDAEAELSRILRPGDLCLTLGAGDLTTLPDRFLRAGRTGPLAAWPTPAASPSPPSRTGRPPVGPDRPGRPPAVPTRSTRPPADPRRHGGE